jgi:hypothetical protein
LLPLPRATAGTPAGRPSAGATGDTGTRPRRVDAADSEPTVRAGTR